MGGVVVRGDGRGRQMGFPTANVLVTDAEKLVPAPGIYACWATVDQHRAMGALHIGPRPTFPGADPTVEVHLLDFDGNIYGRRIKLEVVEAQRSIVAFDTVYALAAQMTNDVMRTRELLEGRQ